MKLIKPSFKIINQEPGLDGMLKHIELCGRACYKSEDKSTEGSFKRFVDNLIKSGHTSVLEHGTLYLRIPWVDYDTNDQLFESFTSKYSRLHYYGGHNPEEVIITSNYRVLIESGLTDIAIKKVLKYLVEPTEFHDKRVSVRFICDRGISHELVRHRVFSFSQESTRYCNYSKDRFSNGVTFIIPCWSKAAPGDYGTLSSPLEIQFDEYGRDIFEREFINSLINDEYRYMNILEAGYTAQQARAVLPNALKTEVIMTGFIKDWEHFFKLRCHTTAHPQMRELTIPLMVEFIKRGYIKEEV